MKTIHKQVSFFVPTKFNNRKFKVECDEAIADVIFVLNKNCFYTDLSCQSNTNNTIWIYFSLEVYKQFMNQTLDSKNFELFNFLSGVTDIETNLVCYETDDYKSLHFGVSIRIKRKMFLKFKQLLFEVYGNAPKRFERFKLFSK